MAADLDPSLAGLLDVQAEDNRIEVLRHRLATLPERKELAARQAQVAELDARAEQLAVPRHELERNQKRLEDEVALVRSKADQDEASLYGGRVSAVRELQALQDEVASLRRRASELEDRILELMVELEPLVEEAASLESRREGLEADARAATVALAEAEAVVDRRAGGGARPAGPRRWPPPAPRRWPATGSCAPGSVVPPWCGWSAPAARAARWPCPRSRWTASAVQRLAWRPARSAAASSCIDWSPHGREAGCQAASGPRLTSCWSC